MINIFPTRTNRNCLLVSSDQHNRTDARREIAQWAAERQLPLPRRPRRLTLVEDNTVVTEWVVIEREEHVGDETGFSCTSSIRWRISAGSSARLETA